jgi:glycosyltransferase involved in cell wall biosynthesis
MMVVFPNYAAKRRNGSVMLELSHGLLCDPLTEFLSCLTVAAQIDTSEGSGTYREVSNPKIRFVSLGERGSRIGLARKLLEYVRLIPRVRRTVRDSNFCYIFAPGNVGLVAWFFCIILGRPYALYLRGEWRIGTPRTFRWAQSFLIKGARFILCTGTGLAKKMERLNPRTEAVVPMSEVLAFADSDHSASGGAITGRLLFVGQLVVEKGIYELIDALQMVHLAGCSEARLTLVGSGQERNELVRHIAAAGLSDSVDLSGLVGDPAQLAAIYRSHDLFCFPTYHEGFPRVIYESMWFRLPVIVTRVGQIESVIKDNINGLFVKTRDARSLANAICLLLRDRKLRFRLASNARTTAEPIVATLRTSNHGRQVVHWMRRERIALISGLS